MSFEICRLHAQKITLWRDTITLEVFEAVPTAALKVRLAVLRAERGLTQRQLALRAGIRADTVSALERGDTAGMRFDTMARLCEALGCQPGELFDLDDDGHRVPLFGGDDEDTMLLERLTDPVRVDGPTFLEVLLRGQR